MPLQSRPFLAAALLLIMGSPASSADRLLTVTATQRQKLGIRTAIARPAEATTIATLPATITPPPGARVAVSAPFAGVIRQSYAVAGQAVQKDEALATVFSREVLEMGAELARARARTAVARSAAARSRRRTASAVAPPRC